MNLYNILGVDKSADKEQIKKAHRAKAKIHHTDNGGNSSDFHALTIAYKILSDDEKRIRYDSGESIDDIKQRVETKESRAQKILMQMFSGAVMAVDVEQDNLVNILALNLTNNIAELEKVVEGEIQKKKKFEKTLKRIKSNSANNFFKDSALAAISTISSNLIKLKSQLDDLVFAKKILEDFSYETDNRLTVLNQFFTSTSASTSYF